MVAVRPGRRQVIADCAWRADHEDWKARSVNVLGLSPSRLDEITPIQASKVGAEAVGAPFQPPWEAGRSANGKLVLGLAGARRGFSVTDASLLATAVEVVLARQQASSTNQSNAVLKERARIASLIHQGASQELATVLVQLEILEEFLEREPSRAREFVSEIRETTRQAMASMRAALVELTPAVSDGSWLCVGLKRLVDNFVDDWGVELSFTFEGEPQTIGSEVLGLVFAFVTEGLTNFRKYSASKRGHVRATCDNETILVSVHDDGPAASEGVTELPGHGLNILWGRARLLGGDLRVAGQAEGGTEVLLEIPI
jgi:signal transduction histidine kinase